MKKEEWRTAEDLCEYLGVHISLGRRRLKRNWPRPRSLHSRWIFKTEEDVKLATLIIEGTYTGGKDGR